MLTKSPRQDVNAAPLPPITRKPPQWGWPCPVRRLTDAYEVQARAKTRLGMGLLPYITRGEGRWRASINPPSLAYSHFHTPLKDRPHPTSRLGFSAK